MAKEKKEGKIINTRDRVEVKCITKSKHMKEGETYNVHPIMAERLKKRKIIEIVK